MNITTQILWNLIERTKTEIRGMRHCWLGEGGKAQSLDYML